MRTFHLSILTPQKVIFEGDVFSLIARGTLGYLEILAHHAHFITTLEIGKVTVLQQDLSHLYYTISSGYLEVSDNQASLLANAIDLVDDAP